MSEPIIPLIATIPERLAILETRVEHLVEQNLVLVDRIEKLLEFKHKGLGALAFATAIVGSSILGAIMMLINWVKHP